MGAPLHNRLRGKKIAAVISNGHVLVLKLEDTSEVRIAWVDDNGAVLKGMPVVEGIGYRMRADGMREIVDGRNAGTIDKRASGLVLPTLGRAQVGRG